MTKRDLKIDQIGLSRSLFHDVYYKVMRASWISFLLWVSSIYLAINFIFALIYFYSPAEILNAHPDSLWDAFIFSFQTSSTIGYGHFLPKTDATHVIVIVDTLIGILYVAIMTGFAFSKLARPQSKILFTDKCIISEFDGVPTLMFRLANGRDNHIVDASLNVAVLLPYISKEGHQMRRFHPLKLASNNNPTFSLTWTIMHPIDKESPLHGIEVSKFKDLNLVIFASVTGIDDVLSQTIHANHRYN